MSIEFCTGLTVTYSSGKARPKPGGGIESGEVILQLAVNKKKYKGVGDSIETAFGQLKNQLAGNYKFKNCYGCMYGDYSIFGQSSLAPCYVL